MKKCTCGANIDFIKTPQGKYLPVDVPFADIFKHGEILVRSDGEVIKYRNGMAMKGLFYRPHWATCKDREKFKK